MKIGSKLKLIREAEGMGRADFCQLIDMPIDTLKSYEVRGRTPTSDKLSDISQIPSLKKYSLWLIASEISLVIGQVSPSFVREFSAQRDDDLESYQSSKKDPNSLRGKTVKEVIDILKQPISFTHLMSGHLDYTVEIDEYREAYDITTSPTGTPQGTLVEAFERTITTCISLGWLTPREGVNFEMLSDVFLADFEAVGGQVLEVAPPEHVPQASSSKI